MKVLMVNGSPHDEGCTYTALSEAANVLQEEGIDVELLNLGKMPIHGCMACNACRKTFRCVINDDPVNAVADRLDEFDAIVLGSPVYYAAPSGQICCFADRLWYCSGTRMANKLGASVVSCRRGGATAAFDRLNKYFTISNMPVVSSCYWNQVHGFTPEDVRKDEEGLQTMRYLGQNMAWLLKSIEAGRKAGIEEPQREPRVFTNFID